MHASENCRLPKIKYTVSSGLPLAGIGSAIFTGCRPLASAVPPNGSPNGFDQKSVGALQSAPIAFLPLLVNSAPFFSGKFFRTYNVLKNIKSYI